MRPLSKDLQEFIRLAKANGVEFLIVGAFAMAFHGRDKDLGDIRLLEQTRPQRKQK